MRLYSIASSRYGDSGDGRTCTLCVVRVVYHGAQHSTTWHSTGPAALAEVAGGVGQEGADSSHRRELQLLGRPRSTQCRRPVPRQATICPVLPRPTLPCTPSARRPIFSPSPPYLRTDPKTGLEVHGLCSNYISDRQPGDELAMTGPSGTALLLPPDHFTRPIVCVATGTGIAPFRSFWRRLFFDGVPGQPLGYQVGGGPGWGCLRVLKSVAVRAGPA